MRATIISTLCALVLVLTGCSTLRFAYSQGHELAYWWLDGYADFDDAQSRLVRDALGQWFAWHRSEELPVYIQLMTRLRGELTQPTTPERACAWWALLRGRMDAGIEHGVPMAAGLALTLTDAQLRHVEQHDAKVNDKFRDEYLQPDPDDRRKAAVGRTVDRVESIYGELDKAQRQLVSQRVAQSPFDPALWLVERQRRQQDALQTLRRLTQLGEPAGLTAVEGALRSYAERVQRSPNEAYRRYAERLQQYNCDFAAALHNSTRADQRLAAARKLEGWENDLRALTGAVSR